MIGFTHCFVQIITKIKANSSFFHWRLSENCRTFKTTLSIKDLYLTLLVIEPLDILPTEGVAWHTLKQRTTNNPLSGGTFNDFFVRIIKITEPFEYSIDFVFPVRLKYLQLYLCYQFLELITRFDRRNWEAAHSLTSVHLIKLVMYSNYIVKKLQINWV